MKNALLLASLLSAVVGTAAAATFEFQPSTTDRDGKIHHDLGDLDHHKATTWGINFDGIPEGEDILSATLTIKNIWDWRAESDSLFIHLLDNPKQGVTTKQDDPYDNVTADFFQGEGVHLDTWTDPVGGRETDFNYVYEFSDSDLVTLTDYITNLNSPVMKSVWVRSKWVGGVWIPGHWAQVVDYTPADFGFGFDPDCHYYNDGVSFVIETGKRSVPDGGSTLLLMGATLGAVIAFRRRLAR